MKRGIIIAAAAAALLAGCMKQAVQSTYDKQETTISSFVDNIFKSDTTATVTYNHGTVRVTLHDTLSREGALADSLRFGGTVSFYYAGYVLSGSSVSSSNMFATNRAQSASDAGWAVSDSTIFEIATIPVDDSLIPGLRYGLEGVQGQDECYILFSGEYGWGRSAQGTIPAKSALAYHIWVNSIDND